MAAKKKSSTPADELEEPTQTDVDLDEFFDEMQADSSTVDVKLVEEDNSKTYIKRLGWDVLRENPLEVIRAKYGAGKYQLVFRDQFRRYRGSTIVRIGPEKPGEKPNGNPSINPSGEDTKFMRDILLAMIAKQSPAPVDVGAILSGMAAMMVAIKPAAAPQTDSPAAMLTAVSGVFSTLRGSQSKDEDWLTKTKTVIEIANSIKGGGGDGAETTGWDVLSAIGKELAGRIQLPMIGGPPAMPALPPAPAQVLPPPTGGETIVPLTMQPQPTTTATATGATISPAATPAPAAERKDVLIPPKTVIELITAALTALKRDAYKDIQEDVDLNNEEDFQESRCILCIDWMFTHKEEPAWAAVLGSIKQGATLNNLLQFDPEIAQNPKLIEWFSKLYDGLRAEIPSEVDRPRPNGNAGHIAGDAPSGVQRTDAGPGSDSVKTG